MTIEEKKTETTVKVGVPAFAAMLRLLFFTMSVMLIGLAAREFYGDGHQYLVQASGFLTLGVLINDGKTNC
jgi:hypothetical protein